MTPFIEFWQHIPEHINPVFLTLGPLSIRYYGLMFMLSIVVTYWVALYGLRPGSPYSREKIDDYFVRAAIGVLLGGRLGYVLFYHFDYYLHNPLEIILPFDLQTGRFIGISGMSYHGGLLGVIVMSYFFTRKEKIPFLKWIDFVMPAVPAGYTFGRIGNFLNGELFGRVTARWWGMYFPSDAAGLLRHPSQLYEAFFEGIILFLFLWQQRHKQPFQGYLLSVYLMAYGLIRFMIEFTREPDAHLGLVAGPFSMGQVLCMVMMAAGAALFFFRRTNPSGNKPA
ncbi:MAG: prolipoprotein diacylglyceryl transferase [Candidatus Omnitrophica bacterium CG11_big_fil_rev_8_21_14_0_20_45_26]|uniref:Phosphatidylglycerol--prolipoprotein diacylglyceryl transferase n=1 Tax=Candidatus Abzuiibacterium crystallinum TaxID=1974748 RepID=A0A2H0LQ48_9BACT|nr:MAG: prolipoprotein diacylglyceryl transferase [Candidatus Omnitrophica bacterium CG11_big_fil_rev_8_21_14_0_20_45_26]PIW65780.1 MAG: prolipoprotein diacylglyceryl transferase [Candidatus Omnitrophica bacterium CG12_big_fil_rev_8_21_14_0_65_45_16]